MRERSALARFQRTFTTQARSGLSESRGSSPAILFFDESDDLFGKRSEIEQHDGPVVLGFRSIRSIPPDLRKNLVVVKAPQPRWWHRLLRSD